MENKNESKSSDIIDVSAYARIVDKQIPIDEEFIDVNAEKVFDEELELIDAYKDIYLGNHIRVVVEKTLDDIYSISIYYFLNTPGYCAWLGDVTDTDIETLGDISSVVREIVLNEKGTFEARGGGYATGEAPYEMGIEFEETLTESASFVLDPAYFSVDTDNAYFKGYHNPKNRWNGWAMPYFTKDVAMEIAQRYSSDETGYSITYDEQKDVFVMEDENYEDEYIEEIPKYTYGTPDGTKDLYPIGAGCWIWDDYTRDEMENNGDADYIFESLQKELDFKYKGIWVRHIPDTNTLQFIVSSEKAEELNLDDTVIDTINYNNQSEDDIKEYIDTQLDNKFFTE